MGDKVKAFGAGLLSSFGEMQWSCAESPSREVREMGGMIQNHPDLLKPTLKPFDPAVAATTAFPITTYQPIYFCADSMLDMREKMSSYADNKIAQPFYPQYEPLTQSIRVTKSVVREPRTSTLELQAQKQREYFESLEK